MAKVFTLYKRVGKETVFNLKKQIEVYTGEKYRFDLDDIEDAQFKVATYKLDPRTLFIEDIIYLVTAGAKDAYIYDNTLADSAVDYFMEHPDTKFIYVERALDSTKKSNLKNRMQDKFFAF